MGSGRRRHGLRRRRALPRLKDGEPPGRMAVLLVSIVSMRVGLIRRSSSDRVHEEPAEYEADKRRRAD